MVLVHHRPQQGSRRAYEYLLLSDLLRAGAFTYEHGIYVAMLV
jgi:hypothetical protein